MAIDADAPGELSGGQERSDPGIESEPVDYDATEEVVDSTRRTPSPLLLAGIAGLVAVIALGSLSVWLGFRAQASQQAKTDRELYLQVAKQGALNLTTIDYQNADADIQRILDSATGQFRDDFSKRVQPFVDVVEKGKSTSTGTVTEAGLESVDGDEARAIVAVSVKTAVDGVPEEQPRSWRMQLTLQRSGSDIKISNVGFVA